MPERGVSAISYLARAIVALETHAFPYRHSDLLGVPSVNVGIIEGGVAGNIVPDRCSATVTIRLVAGQSPDDVEPQVRTVLQTVARESGLPVEVNLDVIGSGPALETAADHPLVRAVVEALGAVRGTAPVVRGFTGGTEAGILCRTYGMPMVIVGPGQLEQAHQVNEHVEVAELAQAARVYCRVARTLLAD
jgi:succinyl-diaminopimelate desuccinylase